MKHKLWRNIFLSALVTGGLTDSANALDREMARFAAEKETQAREIADAQTDKVASIVWSFFDAVRVDDWETATNLFARLRKLNGRYSPADKATAVAGLQTAVWSPISETFGAYEEFHSWDNKLLHRFGREMMETIPKRSIFLGGSEPGRFIISALSESHRDGEPFFTLSQNQLADATYLDYLRKIHGGKINIPTAEDSQKAFQEYLNGAQQRLKDGKLKPGEDVRIVDNRVQVSGLVAVMEINGLLVKLMMQKNPDREFYLDEGFPLDWTYPHLSPQGPIFKLNRTPLASLSAETVAKNHEYWRRLTDDFVGGWGWLTEKTTTRELCNMCESIHRGRNLAVLRVNLGFMGDKSAKKSFSKLRSAIGGLYVWRANHAKDTEEKERMTKAAELAYRQAFALCPTVPETVYGYGKLLKDLKRPDDALMIGKTSLGLAPDDNPQAKELIRSLKRSE